MALNPFDVVKNILRKETRYSDEVIQKEYPLYMINKILSNDSELMVIANLMNENCLTNKMHYDCLYYGIPKTNKFIKYHIKKEAPIEEIRYLVEFFQVNTDIAKSYFERISEEEKKMIIEFYKNRGEKKK